MRPIHNAWSFVGQALSEYAATMAPSARAGFTQLAQQHIDVLDPVVRAAAEPAPAPAGEESAGETPAPANRKQRRAARKR